MIAAAALDALGIFQVATGQAGGAIPGWVLVGIAFLIVVVVPFIAFHRMRLQLVTVHDTRG